MYMSKNLSILFHHFLKIHQLKQDQNLSTQDFGSLEFRGPDQRKHFLVQLQNKLSLKVIKIEN